MRRSVKVAALASAAALLAIGASMTSFAAAKGWSQEDGEWVWLDSSGDKATGTFKLSGTTYYWLNDDGYLGCDELVEYEDNYYYVDETGAMVRNQWKEVENTDDDDDFEETVWYYFQSSGKAYKNGKKNINGKSYIFNEDGKMLFGWIIKDTSSDYSMADKTDDDTDEWKTAQYYAGEANDGEVVTSAWRQIRVHDPNPSLKLNGEEDDYDYWFYFGSNGKKYAADDDGDYTTKTINGSKYAFAYDGHMASEWVSEASEASDGVKYFSDPEVGARVSKGWFKVVPSEKIDFDNSEDEDNTPKWFYANSNGKLAYGEVKSINGKKYIFAENGELKSGLRYVVFGDDHDTESWSVGDDDDDILLDDVTTLDGVESKTNKYVTVKITSDKTDKEGVYYFATPIDTDAAMKTGSCTITVDGDNYAFKFKTSGETKGKGLNGRDGNSYYVNGRKVKADSDDKFAIYVCEMDTSSKKVGKLILDSEQFETYELKASDFIDAKAGTQATVISSAGSIVKSGTKKDGDDYKIVIKDYVVTEIKDSDNNVLWTVKDGKK